MRLNWGVRKICRLYTCQACGEGRHEKCERGYGCGTSDGSPLIGGGYCVCHCRGRSLEKWHKEDAAEWEAHKKRLWASIERAKRRPSKSLIIGQERQSGFQDYNIGGFKEPPSGFVTKPAFRVGS